MGAGYHGGFGNTKGANIQNSTSQNANGGVPAHSKRSDLAHLF